MVLRIALFSWESLHSDAVGGGARHVTELAAALERRGHEVHAFVRQGEGQAPYDVIHGVHYHRCPIELCPDFVAEMNNMCNAMMYFMARTEAEGGFGFDLVHAHDWMCAKGVSQAKRDGRRAVLTIHSTEYGRSGNVHHDGTSERIRGVEGEGIHGADRVIAVSGALADELKGLYHVPDEKLRVVRNGIDCSPYDGRIDPGVCRRSHGMGPLDPMVLFAGRLSAQKGPDLLLEAVPAILHERPDAKVVLAGDGHLRPQLERRADELGVRHAVRFLGAMPPGGELVNLFKSADLVCVPSRNEPFGLVVLEAWAAGKPVVATRAGGPGEMVSPDVDGFHVDPHPESIASGIKRVFGSFEHARWMGARGRVKAAYGFSWDRVAEQTEGVYGELFSAEERARFVHAPAATRRGGSREGA